MIPTFLPNIYTVIFSLNFNITRKNEKVESTILWKIQNKLFSQFVKLLYKDKSSDTNDNSKHKFSSLFAFQKCLLYGAFYEWFVLLIALLQTLPLRVNLSLNKICLMRWNKFGFNFYVLGDKDIKIAAN